MTKFEKFISSLGINATVDAGIGAKIIGPLAVLNSSIPGAYMNPGVIDGWYYNPASDGWYQRSVFDDKLDWSSRASSEKAALLNNERYWREVYNRVEGVSPENGYAGEMYSPSISEIVKKLPEIFDRYKEIAPELIRDFGDYFGIGEAINSSFRDAQSYRDPLVLDLDGDGLELIGAGQQILFDHDADGIRMATGWVGADDGILVRDLDGNGRIDTGRELFGDQTVKSDGRLATNGFDALADLDSDRDGAFTALDAAWNQVQIWRDLNQNGISDEGELFGLDDLGVSSIGVQGQSAGSTLNGNRLAQTASFTLDDVTHTMGAIDFQANGFYREFDTTVSLTEQVKGLPDMRGSGWTRDLREAASLSPDLAIKLEAFALGPVIN